MLDIISSIFGYTLMNNETSYFLIIIIVYTSGMFGKNGDARSGLFDGGE